MNLLDLQRISADLQPSGFASLISIACSTVTPS